LASRVAEAIPDARSSEAIRRSGSARSFPAGRTISIVFCFRCSKVVQRVVVFFLEAIQEISSTFLRVCPVSLFQQRW
jgi:hypothetical protein